MFASGRFFLWANRNIPPCATERPEPGTARCVSFGAGDLPAGQERHRTDRKPFAGVFIIIATWACRLHRLLRLSFLFPPCARCPMNRGTFFGRFSLGRLRGANRSVLDGKPFRCVRSHEPAVPYRPGVCGMVFRCAESVVVNCGPPFLGLRHGAHRENHVFLMRRGLF